jgi:hypothetical protein
MLPPPRVVEVAVEAEFVSKSAPIVVLLLLDAPELKSSVDTSSGLFMFFNFNL